MHELGINSVDVNDMHYMGRYIYLARSDSTWVEHELDYVLMQDSLTYLFF
jgi:isopentenyldiphosphate isomerase